MPLILDDLLSFSLDSISPLFIKNLPVNTINVLTTILNNLFPKLVVSEFWHQLKVIPNPKPLASPVTYYPIIMSSSISLNTFSKLD